MDDELEYVLRRRRSLEAPSGLADRIARAASARRPVLNSFAGRFYDVLRFFLLENVLVPRPALTFSCMLLIGLIVGAQINVEEDLRAPVMAEELASFLALEDAAERGEWL